MARTPKSPKAPKPLKPPASRRRTLVTPEGVDLGIEIATAGARLGAFVLDMLMMAGGLLALTAVVLIILSNLGGKRPDGVEIIWFLGAFLLENFWFVGWEMQASGATPGKRIMKIRVAMRNGGQLTADAIFVRNAMRQMEVFIPLGLLFTGAMEYGAWGWLAGMVWCGIFLLFPLFNRDRLRAGDLVGGTWVVEAPRVRLAPDLASGSGEKLARYAFTQVQLDAYGVMELQVLEDVLRRMDRQTMAAVATRIRSKISWSADPGETDFDFLSAYYAGLRQRLEQRLLFGHRRRDKFDHA
jgi:uncharacterized RDD family membrane protein YckC